MKINGEEVITKVIAFKDNIFEFGKPYYIMFNDESDCVYTLKSFNGSYRSDAMNAVKQVLINDGIYGLFNGLYQNDTVASFICIMKGMACECFELKIPVSVCDDSEAVAAGMLSPVEIIACDKMEDEND